MPASADPNQILRFATTCVRVDTTPLFGAKTKMQPLKVDSPQNIGHVQNIPKPDGVKNMADLLDEILESPSLTTQPLHPLPASRPQPSTGNWGANFQPTSFARKPNLDLNDLSLSEQRHHQTPLKPSSPPPTLTQPDSSDEMDWSPSISQHRAFSSYRQPGPSHQGFSQAPTEEKKGAFWYRVPPAPVAPAHRLFNPPNQPRLRNIPPASVTNSPETINFRGADGRTNRAKVEDIGEGGGGGGGEVAFARPSFFPPTPGDDPRNGLAELLGESFTLRQSEERREKGSWIGGLFGGRN